MDAPSSTGKEVKTDLEGIRGVSLEGQEPVSRGAGGGGRWGGKVEEELDQ